MNMNELKTSIEKLVIPNLTLSQVERGIDQRAFASAIEKRDLNLLIRNKYYFFASYIQSKVNFLPF